MCLLYFPADDKSFIYDQNHQHHHHSNLGGADNEKMSEFGDVSIEQLRFKYSFLRLLKRVYLPVHSKSLTIQYIKLRCKSTVIQEHERPNIIKATAMKENNTVLSHKLRLSFASLQINKYRRMYKVSLLVLLLDKVQRYRAMS